MVISTLDIYIHKSVVELAIGVDEGDAVIANPRTHPIDILQEKELIVAIDYMFMFYF